MAADNAHYVNDEALAEIRWIIEQSDGLLGLSHPDPMTWETALELYCPTLRKLLER